MLVGLSVVCNLFVSYQECQDLPSSNLVNTFIPGSRWTLLILGSLGPRSRSQGSNMLKLFPIN